MNLYDAMKVLSTRTGDMRYWASLNNLTDEELLFCLENETRLKSLETLRRQARLRGLRLEKKE